MAKQQSPQEPDNSSFKEQRDILNEINAELGKQINNVKEASKSYSELGSIAFKLQNSEEEISKLSGKQLQALKEKSQIALRDLKAAADRLQKEKGITDLSSKVLKNRKDLTANERSLLTAANEKFQVEESFVKQVEEELNLYTEINNKLGIFGGVLKGISKIPILGDIFDANQALDAARDKVKETGSGVAGLAAGFKNIGSQITAGALNPSNMLLSSLTFILDIFFELDKAAGDFAKSQNITYQDALKARESYASMAVSSGDLALNAERLMETQTAIGAQLGTNAKLNEADLKTFTKLREQAGYTNEELMGIQQLSLVNGKSLEQNTKDILGGAKAYASRNKLVVNEKQILKDISSASSSLKLSLGGSADALARSAVQAKQFGINLEQAEKISQSLLDFEGSIENELSAELITGKNLNLERARGLALNGDAAAAAAEIAKQVGTSADFGRMNVIQQEAIAKAAGMTRDELAQSLIEREALAKLSEVEGKTAQEKFNNLVEQVGLEEAKKQLGDEQLATQFAQQSNADMFAQTMENVKGTLVSIIDGPMGKILSMIGDLLKNTKVVYGVFGALATLLGGKMLVSLVQTIAKLGVMVAQAVAYAAAWAIANPIMALVGLGVAAGVGALVYSQMKDGVINPDGGLVVSGEKGSIQLDPKDSIIAGTNLFGSKKMDDGTIDSKGKMTSSGGKGSINMGGGVDTTAIINAINNLANRPINVSIDGKKVIEATTGNQPNTAGDESRKNSYRVS